MRLWWLTVDRVDCVVSWCSVFCQGGWLHFLCFLMDSESDQSDHQSLQHEIYKKKICNKSIKANPPPSFIWFRINSWLTTLINKQGWKRGTKKSKLRAKIKSQRHWRLPLNVCNNDAVNKESNPESLLVKIEKSRWEPEDEEEANSGASDGRWARLCLLTHRRPEDCAGCVL